MGSEFDRLRKDARFFRHYSSFLDLKSRERILELRRTNAMLRSFVVEKRTGGQRLIQLAAVLFAIPDPITGAAGVPVLIAGQLTKMKSSKRTEIQRVFDGVNWNISSLISLAESSLGS